MKKIGILHGKERSFPSALIERINAMKEPGITAEEVLINQVRQGEPVPYAVILDRISQDVPFYRAYLKNAALKGTAVVNNPFWWSADEKFFNNCLATKLGVAVPKTVILPSKDMPADCSAESFSNLAFPLDWDGIFQYIGWPAYFKPHSGGGWKNVYKVRNPDEFFKAYAETGQLVMLLQSEVVFDDYYRCYCIGGTDVRTALGDAVQQSAPGVRTLLAAGLLSSQLSLDPLRVEGQGRCCVHGFMTSASADSFRRESGSVDRDSATFLRGGFEARLAARTSTQGFRGSPSGSHLNPRVSRLA